MRADSVSYDQVVIRLTADEAKFIQELVQNPIGELWEEPVEQAKKRHDIFNAIKNLNL